MGGFWDFLSTLVESKNGRKKESGGPNITINTEGVSTSQVDNAKYQNWGQQPAPRTGAKTAGGGTRGSSTSANIVKLQSFHLYASTVNGKTPARKFYLLLNKTFGMDIKLKNTSGHPKQACLSYCIYDGNGDTLFNEDAYIRVDGRSTAVKTFQISSRKFSRMRPGRYKVNVWIDNEKVKACSFDVVKK